MTKRKPQPRSQSESFVPASSAFEYASSLTWGKAMRESKGQTLEQAAAAFLEHWGHAEAAMRTILKAGDPELTRVMVDRINTLLFVWILPMIQKGDVAAGQFAFTYAQDFCREVMLLAQEKTPPDWLVARAPKEYEVPWLLKVNGQPMPGFPESDTALHWGHAVVKRGKSRFDAEQTRVVAAAIKQISRLRTLSESNPATFAAMLGASHWRGASYAAATRASLKRIAALPPLSAKTKGEWWPVVAENIRGQPHLLPPAKFAAIRKTVSPETDKRVMDEFVNNYCRKAFDALCPAD